MKRMTYAEIRKAGHSGFFRAPMYDNASPCDVLVLGVPYDGGATFNAGQRFGPQHVRQSSLFSSHPVLSSDLKLMDGGDLVFPFLDRHASFDIITKEIEAVAQRHHAGVCRWRSFGHDSDRQGRL